MDAKRKNELDKKVSDKLKWKSPFVHSKIPSREFIQTLPRHGVGLSKAFCERLRREKRFDLLYEKAKAQDILIVPNPELKPVNGVRKTLLPTENLIYLTCRGHGEAGFLKLKDFVDEFVERTPTGPKQDSRAFVV